MGWIWQFTFGIFIGVLVGFLIGIKHNGGGGLLKRSDVILFVLGMGVLFGAIATAFCKRMDMRNRTPQPAYQRQPFREELKLSHIPDLLSLAAFAGGLGMILLALLRTFKILAH